jgi:hypothetical protein
MKYGENNGLVTGKMKKNIADFHILGLFIAYSLFERKTKFRLSCAGAKQNLGHENS